MVLKKIKKHRISNGVNEYLVKWKGLSEEDNTWVTKSEITQGELDEYNKHKSPSDIEIATSVTISTTKQVNSKSKSSHINFVEIKDKIRDRRIKSSSVKHMFICMYLIAVMWMLSVVNGVNIKGNFKFCSHNDNSPVLDFDESCNLERSVSKFFKTGKFNLLERSLYLINGFGYACSKTKITVKTKMSFFGSEDSYRDERKESIDKDECLAMVISKKCQTQKLSCDSDRLLSVLEPAIEFAWMKGLTFHSYYCFVNKVEIKGHQLNLPLFANGKTPCLPKDL